MASRSACLSATTRFAAQRQLAAQAGFGGEDAFFREEYGARWPRLLEALQRPKNYAAWANPFAADAASFMEQHEMMPLAGSEAACSSHVWLPRAPSSARLPKPPSCASTGLKLFYPLDLASTLPVLALTAALRRRAKPRRGSEQPLGAARVLDACAAPGGKFMLLAGSLLGAAGSRASLTAAEKDRFRLGRLQQNLRLYLPPRLRMRLVPGEAASRAVRATATSPYDAVLLDAPCSSDRERLLRAQSRAPGAPAPVPWSRSQARANARRQLELLSTAMDLAPRGLVVYATCALSSVENDGVVSEALQQSAWQVVKEGNGGAALLGRGSELAESVEETQHGWQLLPDRGGWGPIFWTVLQAGDA